MISQAQFPTQGLYAITPENILRDENSLEKIEAVILGGAKVIQLRLKDQDQTQQSMEKIIQIRKICEKFSVAFIINDDVNLAFKIEADGVHLGQHDISYRAARRILGNDKIIGISCYNNLERAVNAAEKGATYIALGSFYNSLTKKRALRCGIDILQQTSKKIKIPIVAIGGITPKNGRILVENGANFLACVDALFKDDNGFDSARELNLLFEWVTK